MTNKPDKMQQQSDLGKVLLSSLSVLQLWHPSVQSSVRVSKHWLERQLGKNWGLGLGRPDVCKTEILASAAALKK